MKYPVAERFVSPQGEGLYTGTTMAYIRLVGCSVGQKVCTACDTEFDRTRPDLGGGIYTVEEIKAWVAETRVEHVCLTGGEPLDRDIRPLLLALTDGPVMCHVETSGTKRPAWLDQDRTTFGSPHRGQHVIDKQGERYKLPLWLTVSPKPGYLHEMIGLADEVKVILGGLGDGPGWPSIETAVEWADDDGKLVYVQPRNDRLDIRQDNMKEAIRVVTEHPQLRLSTQLHKWLHVR